jgi:hypothetical protein
MLIRMDNAVQKLFLTYQMTIKAAYVYSTITSQTPIENSTNPISAATVQRNLPLNICNNVNVKIHSFPYTKTN